MNFDSSEIFPNDYRDAQEDEDDVSERISADGQTEDGQIQGGEMKNGELEEIESRANKKEEETDFHRNRKRNHHGTDNDGTRHMARRLSNQGSQTKGNHRTDSRVNVSRTRYVPRIHTHPGSQTASTERNHATTNNRSHTRQIIRRNAEEIESDRRLHFAGNNISGNGMTGIRTEQVTGNGRAQVIENSLAHMTGKVMAQVPRDLMTQMTGNSMADTTRDPVAQMTRPRQRRRFSGRQANFVFRWSD